MYHLAYGSNMDLEFIRDWLRKVGQPVSGLGEGIRVKVPGYRFAFSYWNDYWQGATINLISDPESDMEGVVVEVDDITMRILEEKEDVPGAYVRLTLTVEDEAGRSYEAVCFQCPPENCSAGLKPARRYLDTILNGARAAGLSEGYIARLAATETLP